jgi:PKD repeat protein
VVKRLLAATAIGFAGCSLSNQDAPALSGPSEFALSLAVTASPDLLTQDGQEQSMVAVVARDANGQPARGRTMRLAMFVGGANLDYGTLSTKTISTDNSGHASAIYTAPLPPPITDTENKVVKIQVLPAGTDYSNTEARYVSIRLVRPGVILPPNPPLVTSFFYSPVQPHENEQMQFDASASTGAIVSYAWNFGDASAGTGSRPTHTYAVAGVYNVTLTLTDTNGVQVSSTPQPVTVIIAPDPVASFTISPSDPGVNDDVHFDGSASTVPAGRSVVRFDWNFGDGAVGSGQRATHKFGKAFTYTIVLTVTDSTGRKGVTSQTVQVK